MSSSQVNLKEPWLAAVLAWLIPGLGHWYQDRRFKAVLYFVCIMGTFVSGMILGDGKVLQFSWERERRTYGYLAQVLVGLPSLPALVQAWRLPDEPRDGGWDRRRARLEKPLKGTFHGILDARLSTGETRSVAVEGTIQVEEAPDGGFRNPVTGTFVGMTPEGSQVDLSLMFLNSIEPAIFPSRDRGLSVDVSGQFVNGESIESGSTLTGVVENARSIFNSYAAPLDEIGLREVNGNLGKFYELGLVFTWIAGLLNLLAIWDAFEGPAYGYGDEEPAADGDASPSTEPESQKQPATAGAAAPTTASPPNSGSSPPSTPQPKKG